MIIPKNIFQTWKNETVPDNWKNAQQSVILMNPNWKYTLYTDSMNDTIIKNYFSDFYSTYISFKYPIQRADAIRYCILYLYGGIYLDLDYIANKSFDDLVLNNEVGLIRSANTPSILTNSFLISIAKSEFWLKCIQQMTVKLPFYKRISKHFEIMYSTGPMMITGVYKKNKNLVEILEKIQTPCNVCVKVCNIDTSYYLNIIKGNSWHSWDSTLLNFILCNQLILIVIIVVIIIHTQVI
jgi:mannosyltransferase OCH1-like enzyme